MEQSVGEILSGPDYFKCERFRVWMRKQICVDRQVKNDKPAMGQANFLECLDCEQGRQVAEEMGVKVKITKTLDSPNKSGNDKEGSSAMTDTKICNKCGQEKAVDDFEKNKLCKDGHSGTCRVCRRKRTKELYAKRKENSPGTRRLKKKPASAPQPAISADVVEAPVVQQGTVVNDTGEVYNAAAALFIRSVERKLMKAIVEELKGFGQ